MSMRLDVPLAIKALILAALPTMVVLGIDDEAPADRIPPEGRAVVAAGDPGEPEIDLSPVTYNYQHSIPVQISALPDLDRHLTAIQVLDERIELIADAVEADRTLGGLVEYLDGASPSLDDIYTSGSATAATAELMLVATYATTKPL